MELMLLPVPFWIFASVNVLVVFTAVGLYMRLWRKVDEHSFSITNIDYWAARVDLAIARQEKAERRKMISYIADNQASDGNWTNH